MQAAFAVFAYYLRKATLWTRHTSDAYIQMYLAAEWKLN